jgi:hypothetical protein
MRRKSCKWKAQKLPETIERFDIKSPQIKSIMEQKLGPIDRASFKRKIHYYDAIFSKAKLD